MTNASAPRWEWLDRFFNGLVAVATIVGVIFLILQWDQTEKALHEARVANELTRKAQVDASNDAAIQVGRYERQLKVAEDTAKAATTTGSAAQVSASAAERQARISEIATAQSLVAFMAQHRAKLAPSISQVKLPTADNIVDVRLQLENSGGSAGRRIRTWVLRGIAPPDRPPTVQESVWASSKFAQLGDVLPAEKGSMIRIDAELPAPEVTRFRNGEDVYLFLRIRYCDAFGAAHWIHQCWHGGIKTPAGFLASCGDTSGDDTLEQSKAECQP
jgi:hypothetical protein